jgi:hypothetical protein
MDHDHHGVHDNEDPIYPPHLRMGYSKPNFYLDPALHVQYDDHHAPH